MENVWCVLRVYRHFLLVLRRECGWMVHLIGSNEAIDSFHNPKKEQNLLAVFLLNQLIVSLQVFECDEK